MNYPSSKRKYMHMKYILSIPLFLSFFFLNEPFYAQDSKKEPHSGTVTDFDGNVYHWVRIGRQKWIVENLRTTHYTDGEAIPLVESVGDWQSMERWDKAYCFYDTSNVMDNKAYKRELFGALYTWAAATRGQNTDSLNLTGVQGVCPSGWYIPANKDWEELAYVASIKNGVIREVNGRNFAGMRLKSKGNIEDGTGVWPKELKHYGTNETGFSGVPGGKRSHSGWFGNIGGYGIWWSSERLGVGEAFIWVLCCDNDIIEKLTLQIRGATSVRCVSY